MGDDDSNGILNESNNRYDNLRDNIDDIISEAKKYDVKYLMCGSIPHEGRFDVGVHKFWPLEI